MFHFPSLNTILVPQGAEYKAVCRGLSRVSGTTPTVMPIPVGIKPLTQYLQQLPVDKNSWNRPQSRVLVMGICGSLSQRYRVGDIVLYQDCVYQGKLQECDRSFTAQMQSALLEKVSLVKSLTSDRVVWSAAQKYHLGETLKVDVVDMEGFAALEFFKNTGVAVAMLRVVSDDCHHDIPDLTAAINSDGSLNPLPLAIGLLKQPLAAIRLIRGSLKGLKVLEEVTTSLWVNKS
ncbi:phosphorylase [Nostocaceae cyanobacterium CENA357]|uniref:Phosphorylase n=1 Tax=Atlanticothrix silvestris CENA357 TaxID=1725252 RepID=A0A8J7L3Y6_9CYAN|nr:phosphorylase [Atlanticothrix silvestris]MBH8554424.1 phosphorylase [Atlanticothrix silvestris CENA357]